MGDEPQSPIMLEPVAGLKLAQAQILALLEAGKIQGEHGRLRWSSNYTFLLSVCHEGQELKAIYKPQRGERPLWDFPDGTLCRREVAAFLVSDALGWQLVPPTVLRSGPHGLGSFQCFIEHDPEINYFNLDEQFIPQLMRLAAFDYITNNADRKGGHCLVGPGERLWGIDHGICFHTVPKMRTVIWNFAGKAISPELLADIERFYQQCCDAESPLPASLQAQISTAEFEALLARTRRLLKTEKYPRPGHGPSYPWPPV